MKTLAFAAFGAALLAAGAAEAAPQTVGSLYQEQVSATCSNSTNCQVGFATIDSTMALRVDSIDCRITVAKGPAIYQVALTDFGQGSKAGRVSIPAVTGYSTSGSNYRAWVAQSDAAVFYSGARPWVNMYATSATNFSVICTLTGVHKPTNQW